MQIIDNLNCLVATFYQLPRASNDNHRLNYGDCHCMKITSGKSVSGVRGLARLVMVGI